MSAGVLSDTAPARFFDDLLATFERTEDVVEIVPVSLRVAGRSVVLEFAGPRLRSLIEPAFAHLVGKSGHAAEFSIKIFDTATTHASPPAPPWGPNDYLAQGEIAGFNTARFRTSFRVDAGCLSMVDLERRTAIFWIRDPAVYPQWMEAAPLRTILGWWAAGQGLQMVHGAAVGTDEAGVLLTARGGSGKSTSAIRCLMAGLNYAGDDYVIVNPTTHRIYSAYCTAKADDAAVDRFFPHLKSHSAGRIVGDDTDKNVFYLTNGFSSQLSDLPLSAVAVPELTDDASTTFTPSGPATALRAIAPTTLFQIAGAGMREFEHMAELVRSVPIYSLRISPNDDIAGTVSELLQAVEGATA